MSYVEEIVSGIETKIVNILGASYKKSDFVYFVEKTNTKTSNDIFRVSMGSGKRVEGSLRTTTIQQEFYVQLTKQFTLKGDTDVDLRTKIFEIYDDHEKLYKESLFGNFDVQRVVLISEFDISGPEIDLENSTITIGATYIINYRQG